MANAERPPARLCSVPRSSGAGRGRNTPTPVQKNNQQKYEQRRRDGESLGGRGENVHKQDVRGTNVLGLMWCVRRERSLGKGSSLDRSFALPASDSGRGRCVCGRWRAGQGSQAHYVSPVHLGLTTAQRGEARLCPRRSGVLGK